MKRTVAGDFALARPAPVGEGTFAVLALVVSILLIHSVFTVIIRPRAEAILQQAEQTAKSGQRQTTLRSIFVIVKDPEQEVAITLALWATALIGWRWREATHERGLLGRGFMESGENFVVLPDDVRTWSRQVENLAPDEQDRLLPRALRVGLARFAVTRSVHETAAAVSEECQTEASRLDADNSMLRFVVWGIPAIGFVGTARGIGNALQDAQSALNGDISGVTVGLGITFNSTLVALTLSIGMMFLLHQLQHLQDRLVLDTKLFIDRRLIARLRVS
jgi:biopolymer transport protein ExbB/TolQ